MMDPSIAPPPECSQAVQGGVMEVGGGDLQGVEHHAGGFAADPAGGQQAHDLGERGLDGGGILEWGKKEREVAAVARMFGA